MSSEIRANQKISIKVVKILFKLTRFPVNQNVQLFQVEQFHVSVNQNLVNLKIIQVLYR